jgi:site-specific recombinase XerD
MKHKKAYVSIKDFKRSINNNDWFALRATMNHQPASIIAGRKDLAVFLRFCAISHVRRITGNTLIRFFTYCADACKNRPGAINRKRSTLRCYFNHLRLRQVAGAAVFPIEHLPRARQAYAGPIHTLEPQEVIKLLSSIDRSTVIGMRNFTLFSLLYAFGLRLGECLGIRIQDIDWDKGLLTIHGKGRKTRYLPLTDKTVKLLKKWIRQRPAMMNAETTEHLFLSKKGMPLSGRMAQEHFQEIVKNARPFTLKKITPHTLRHAFASHAVDGNCDLLVLKYILGHATLKSTEIYLHPSVNTLRRALNDHLASDILKDIRTRRAENMVMNKRKQSSG